MKTASSEVKKTMLVLTLCSYLQMFSSHPHARGEWHILHTQRCAWSNMAMWEEILFLSTQYPSWAMELCGEKWNIQASKQTKRRMQRLAPIQPATATQSRGGIPGWTTQTITKDESPCKIHVLITVCKVISSVPYWRVQASSMSFSPFVSSFPLFSLSLPPPSSSSAPSVYVSFCP